MATWGPPPPKGPYDLVQSHLVEAPKPEQKWKLNDRKVRARARGWATPPCRGRGGSPAPRAG